MVDKPKRERADGHLDVLGSIPAEYRHAVLQQCERRVVQKGGIIWSQGEPADYVAFLSSGRVMSSYQSRNGRTGTTGFWGPGDLLGAADLGLPTVRQMTVRCLEPCVINTLSIDRFNALVRRFPEVAQAIIRALSIRLRWVAHLAVSLETQNASGRICTVLLALSERFAHPSGQGMVIDLKLTNEDLAAIAGVTRQFANATLGDLKRRGLLQPRRGALVVTDVAALEALAFQR
ncbi:MAG: Crp/Fnr family transcriptional regulator [Betaproteobacteria bacterium]|nr:Crp/Fnr family transcriptional regulator [Betaproteobacteria bacterium]